MRSRGNFCCGAALRSRGNFCRGAALRSRGNFCCGAALEAGRERKCEGDGSRAALPLCTPPCGPLRSKNIGRTSNWECAMIWYLVSHIETLQNTISSRTFLYNVSPTIDSYEALYSIISHTIRTHRSSHNETRNIRHFTHPQSDVSTLFSSVP